MKKYYQNKSGVIVLGGHVQGYGIMKVYGENKIPVILIDQNKINIGKYSKYCKNFYRIDYDDLLDFLLQDLIIEKYRNWLLMPTDDYYVKIISVNKDVLSKYYNILIDDWDKINLFYDKTNSYLLVEEYSIPVPKTLSKVTLNDISEISKKICYPCIIKPAIVKDFIKHFHKKVIVCPSRELLLENYTIVAKKIVTDELLIQEIIDGPNDNQFSVGIFSINGEVQNFVVAKRARQHPIDFGNATTYARTVQNSIIQDYAFKIIREVKLTGVFEVEFKLDEKDKKYKFLEINPRTWKWHLITEAANVPFLMSIYSYVFTGESIKNQNYDIAAWSDFYTDFAVKMVMKKKKIYRKERIRNKISAVWNFPDFFPFIMQGLYLPYFILKRR